jgi:hypothetical protein
LLCHVALQALLSSTTQIDKGFPYSFLWPWLGSGLLTSTGIVLEKYSAIITTVNEQHSDLVGKVMVNHSATVNPYPANVENRVSS